MNTLKQFDKRLTSLEKVNARIMGMLNGSPARRRRRAKSRRKVKAVQPSTPASKPETRSKKKAKEPVSQTSSKRSLTSVPDE